MEEPGKPGAGGGPVETVQLTEASRFRFECRKDLACFTKCCSRIEIVLSPYDILRLKKRLGRSSGAFLERHTTASVHEKSGLPMVALKMRADGERACPFLQPEGCTIYSDRPAICRYYPIGLAALRVGKTGEAVGEERFYFTVREEHCLGHGEEREWTVGEWRRNQGVAELDEFNRDWLSALLRRSVPGADRIDPRQQSLFYLACYDADRFRSFVFESRFLEQFEVEPALVEKIRRDDFELVRFGMRYAKYFLLLEETMRLRPGVLDAWREKRRSSPPDPEAHPDKPAY